MAHLWNNLFWSCAHCNSIKNNKIYEGKIINCCQEDPEQHIACRYADNDVQIEALDQNEVTSTTASLIYAVFNLKNTGMRINNSASRLKALQEEMDKMLGNHTLHNALLKLDGLEEIIYSPYYDGAFLVSTRGGDIELTLGQDFSVGFQGVDEGKIKLYIAESFTFAVYEPRAYVPLTLV